MWLPLEEDKVPDQHTHKTKCMKLYPPFSFNLQLTLDYRHKWRTSQTLQKEMTVWNAEYGNIWRIKLLYLNKTFNILWFEKKKKILRPFSFYQFPTSLIVSLVTPWSLLSYLKLKSIFYFHILLNISRIVLSASHYHKIILL